MPISSQLEDTGVIKQTGAGGNGYFGDRGRAVRMSLIASVGAGGGSRHKWERRGKG